MRGAIYLVTAALTLDICGASFAGARPLVELSCGKKTYQGATLAHNDTKCWLVAADGRIYEIGLKSVTSFRTVAPRFQSDSTLELRGRMQLELGREFEVASEGRYVVCAPPGGARKYAALFDDLYRTFHHYFSVRGFSISQPEFPLVAIVFPTRQEFVAYSKKEGVDAGSGVMGYYLQSSNRVALFDSSGRGPATTARNRGAEGIAGELPPGRPAADWEAFVRGDFFAVRNQSSVGIEASLADTIIHEGTHQVAFNTGLHSRIGETPLWMIEGLATVFESPGVRNPATLAAAKTRMNRNRFVWFGDFAKSRRKPKSLEQFVSSDAMFQSATLDAYSQAWALSFYLAETRPGDYARYLKHIAARDPLKDYPAGERAADFKQAFGSDLVMLEADFLRFVLELN